MLLFASPWWLLGLVPWGAATLWLLWGKRRRVDVPFLKLWAGPVQSPAPKRSLERPPFWLAMAILAMLLAIVGAARPGFRSAGAQGPLLTIIVDRGLSMSALDRSTERYRRLIDEAAPAIRQQMLDGPTELIVIPGPSSQRISRAQWPAIARGFAPTAMDTRSALAAAVGDGLAAGKGPIFVLSDQQIDIADPRIIRIAPADMPLNVGIIHIAARETPTPAVLVRIRNDSDRTSAGLRLLSDGQTAAQQTIDLPARGRQRDYILSAASVGRFLQAEIVADDDVPADNRAFLVRQRVWPIVEPRAAVPREVLRMISRYARLRPPGDGSRRIALTAADALPANEPAAGVTPAEAAASQPSALPGRIVTVHPVTEAVASWPAAASASAAPPPEPGWTPLVRSGDVVLVAMRTSPSRQVWINLATEPWSTSPQFVVFWTNVFNWLGEGAETFAAEAPSPLPAEWAAADGTPREAGLWPGIYRRGDGALRAVNAPNVPIASPAPADWRGAVARLGQERSPATHPVGGFVILTAIAAVLLSAWTFRGATKPA